MWWPNILIYGAYSASQRGATADARGQTKKTVHCEACGQQFYYFLTRTGSGYDSGGIFSSGDHSVAQQRADTNLQFLLHIGVEPIPCPSCGHIQSHMIPKAKRLHRRWMLYLGQILTVGLIPLTPILFVIFHAIFPSPSPLPIPISLITTSLLLVSGVSSFIAYFILSRRFNPNEDEDVQSRIRRGQARAHLIDPTAITTNLPSSYSPLPPHPLLKWFGITIISLFGLFLLSCGGCFSVRWISQYHTAYIFEPHLKSYLALAPSPFHADIVKRSHLPPALPPTGKVGKMIVLSRDERKIDPIHFDLPSPLQASAPEEVLTVVFLSRGKEEMRDDTPNPIIPRSIRPMEYQKFIHVAVFDRRSKTKIAATTVQDSPTTTSQDKILHFLGGLPREPSKK